MRGRSNLLVASWDTLGWTIYKSPTGHEPARLAEAERYLAAAWHNGLHAEVGLHLGELQEALNRPGEALVTYQLAEAASSHVDLRGVQQAPTPLQRELTRRIERLKRVRPNAALKDPAGTLHEQLNLGAGSSGGQTLVMPYRMLLTAEGAQSLVPLETPEGNQGKADPVKDLARARQAVPSTWVPAGSTARLLRSAVMNCHQDVCELMLTPLSGTR